MTKSPDSPASSEAASAAPRRVIGIDPGTRHVGWGVVAAEGNALHRVAGGCIRAGGDDIAARLVAIHEGLQAAIREHTPEAAAVETVFGGQNIRTAIAIGEGRGVALLSAAECGLAVVGYEPAVVKRAVAGSGRAGKEQVQRMIQTLLGLADPPGTDHEADALALAVTHIHHARRSAVSPALAAVLPVRGARGASRRRPRR